MTDEEWALGIDAILLVETRGHVQHRALDLWWTRYTQELPEGHPLRVGTAKWMAAIEGHHHPGAPYPLGSRRWWQFWKPKRPAPPRVASEYEGWSCP